MVIEIDGDSHGYKKAIQQDEIKEKYPEDYENALSQISTSNTFKEVINLVKNSIKPVYKGWIGKEEYEDSTTSLEMMVVDILRKSVSMKDRYAPGSPSLMTVESYTRMEKLNVSLLATSARSLP